MQELKVMNNIRVALFEDNHSFRNGLVQLIDGSEGYEIVGAYPDCQNLLQQISEIKPDIILMDIEMPGMDGIAAVEILKEKHPSIRILMQTVFEENEKIFRSILAGASGYILKNTSPSRILESITETFKGGAPMSPSVATKVLKMVQNPAFQETQDKFNLTEREKEILSCLVEGMSYKLIAEKCFISVETVRGHIRNIYDKLHVHSKSQAVAKAIKKNIV